MPAIAPSDEALAFLTALYHGDRAVIRDGKLVIALHHALAEPVPFGELAEQVVSDSVLDELESRGWIDAAEPPSITERGRYWLIRLVKAKIGRGIVPFIKVPVNEN